MTMYVQPSKKKIPPWMWNNSFAYVLTLTWAPSKKVPSVRSRFFHHIIIIGSLGRLGNPRHFQTARGSSIIVMYLPKQQQHAQRPFEIIGHLRNIIATNISKNRKYFFSGCDEVLHLDNASKLKMISNTLNCQVQVQSILFIPRSKLRCPHKRREWL
jgi:hypothetical protein